MNYYAINQSYYYEEPEEVKVNQSLIKFARKDG